MSSPAPRKATTFRRLTPRVSQTPSTSSPLAQPPHPLPPQSPTHDARKGSTSSILIPPTQHTPDHTALNKPNHSLKASSPLSTPAVSPRFVGKELPSVPVISFEAVPSSTAQENRSQSPRTQPAPLAASTSRHPSVYNDSETTIPSSTPSPAPSSQGTSKPKSAPYRPGFQPSGVRRQVTDEFLSIRRLKRDGEGEVGRMKRIERTKLERRLEKIIALHFPPEGSSTKEKPVTVPQERLRTQSLLGNRRASSFFDFESMKNVKDPSDIWRLLGGQDTKQDTRAMEQRITPWEEDSAVSKCPLCQASFHPLTNRKHHCRLCGRIICSLPPKLPQRPATCSLLFFVDSKTRNIEEVGEGVDYGVRRKRNGASGSRQEEEEKFLRGVRICRDCRPIIMRQQYEKRAQEVPAFVKLYELFISLEHDIEESLPQFQELLLTLSHNDQPTKEASAARKRLLDAFTQYDRLAKKIRDLPCPNGPGSSQDRIQMAILSRANLFLQKNMFPLQSLPRPSISKGTGAGDKNGAEDAEPFIDPDSALAQTLQPLLEQESLLESFIEEAKAHRKFEDVKTLKVNLEEIRREINSVLGSSGLSERR